MRDHTFSTHNLVNNDQNAKVLRKSCDTFTFGYFQLKLNIAKKFAHFNNYYCITDTIFFKVTKHQVSPT